MYFKRIVFPALALLSFGCSSSSDKPAVDTKPLTDAPARPAGPIPA